jgi:hypothetical protein
VLPTSPRCWYIRAGEYIEHRVLVAYCTPPGAHRLGARELVVPALAAVYRLLRVYYTTGEYSLRLQAKLIDPRSTDIASHRTASHRFQCAAPTTLLIWLRAVHSSLAHSACKHTAVCLQHESYRCAVRNRSILQCTEHTWERAVHTAGVCSAHGRVQCTRARAVHTGACSRQGVTTG